MLNVENLNVEVDNKQILNIKFVDLDKLTTIVKND